MKTKTVNYSDLTMLYLSAKAFDNIAKAKFAEIAENNGKTCYEHPVPAAATNAFLAIELYLKLAYADNHWEQNESSKASPANSTQYPLGHELFELFMALPSAVQSDIQSRCKSMTMDEFEKVLQVNANGFMEWRYIAENRSLTEIDYHDLQMVCNAIKEYCSHYMNNKHVNRDEWNVDPHSITTHF